ncbi:FAD-binding oxidoreductase [Nakamurella silvestris]|nr:FAD-binding oxidoreductase [Nakamurella silvestris]
MSESATAHTPSTGSAPRGLVLGPRGGRAAQRKRTEVFVRSLRESSSEATVSTDALDRAAMSHDASHYLLAPAAVSRPDSTEQVVAAMRIAAEHGVPLTFRSGGTSLSGQAGTDGLLVDTRRHFRQVEVLDGGARVRCGPGATVRSVNNRLMPYKTRLGPDPASESACTVGGVVANNSSGMACGTEFNSYATLDSLTFVLPSGTVVDSAAPDAAARLRALEPDLVAGLAALRDRVRANPSSVATITHQFSMKNTMGYSLNAFTDFDEPLDILTHLLVGSEGTLGWIAEATFRTVPTRAHAATGLLVFADVAGATEALPALRQAGAHTLELMDASSLRVLQRDPNPVPALQEIAVDRHTALLVEFQADDADLLTGMVEHTEALGGRTAGLVAAPGFTRKAAERAALWHLRKGLYTAVAGARPPGSTALLEDVVVPPAALTETVTELIALFDRHSYDDAVIFGHAKDGNLHFMINPRLGERSEVRQLDAFTGDLVDLILGQNGSLKAEHGTGRVMAPFVRRQFGDELYQVMRQVKDLCDPRGTLNPGAVLDDRPDAHLLHLKQVPVVDPAVDKCVECGYCEPVCPSRDVTTTPRQRIALMREIAVAPQGLRKELRRGFDRAAVDTCAADSLCVTACPVAIDTGKVMKSFRAKRYNRVSQTLGAFAARHWGGIVTGLRGALAVTAELPKRPLSGITQAARHVVSHNLLPQVGSDLPGPGAARLSPTAATADTTDAVFYQACIGSLFASAETVPGTLDTAAAFQELCRRAGVRILVPAGLSGLCCGTPWQSKGLTGGHREMAALNLAALWTATDGGRLPVVTDAASCTQGLRELGGTLDGPDRLRYGRITFVDSVTFVKDRVLPLLPINTTIASMALHPTCSTTHLGIEADLRALAAAVAEDVFVPPSWGCCGFAGDRGMLHPEVTAAATSAQAAEVNDGEHQAYASCNRTCEMGMSRATGKPYEHILQVLERASR